MSWHDVAMLITLVFKLATLALLLVFVWKIKKGTL